MWDTIVLGPCTSTAESYCYPLYNLYKITMIATKRVAVTEPVWAELSDLKRPGETFSQLLAEMIEREKKARLIEHLKQIADEGDFVELPP